VTTKAAARGKAAEGAGSAAEVELPLELARRLSSAKRKCGE
jgi:hypothetical protein